MKTKMGIGYTFSGMLTLAMLLSGIGMVLPFFSEELGLSVGQAGLIVSMQYIGYTVAVLIGGILADRYGKILILKISMFFFAGATVMLAAAQSYGAVLAAVCALGMFGGVLQNDVTAIALDCEREKQDKNNNIIQVAFSIGAVVTPLLFLLFTVWLDAGYRWVYVILAAFCAVMFGVSLFYKDRTSGVKSKQGVMDDLKGFVREKYWWVACIGMFLYVSAEVTVWGFVPEMTARMGGSFVVSALSTIAIWGAMAVGRALCVWLISKMDMVPIMLIGGVLSAISVAGIALLQGGAVVVAAALAGFFFAPFYPMMVNWMKRLTGAKSNIAIAMVMASGSFGIVVTGWVTGQVGQLAERHGFSYSWMMAVSVGCMVGLVALLLVFGKKRK